MYYFSDEDVDFLEKVNGYLVLSIIGTKHSQLSGLALPPLEVRYKTLVFCEPGDFKTSSVLNCVDAEKNLVVIHRKDTQVSMLTPSDALARIRKLDITPISSMSQENYKKKISEIEAAITSNINNITFSEPVRILKSDSSFIVKGVMNSKNEFMAFHSFHETEVCHILKKDKDNEDIMIFLPEQWVSLAGYDQEFVEKWINNIKKLTNCPINFLGKREFNEFSENTTINRYLTKNSFYAIQLDGNEYYYINYFIFNLLRYLYHNNNNNIPGLTFQLMDYFKTENFFKCLLLAHYSRLYNTYYGIGALASEDKKGVYYQLPNIETDFNIYFKDIQKHKSISNCIETIKIYKDEGEAIFSLMKDKKFDEVVSKIRLYDIEKIKEAPKPYFKNKKKLVADISNPKSMSDYLSEYAGINIEPQINIQGRIQKVPIPVNLNREEGYLGFNNALKKELQNYYTKTAITTDNDYIATWKTNEKIAVKKAELKSKINNKKK